MKIMARSHINPLLFCTGAWILMSLAPQARAGDTYTVNIVQSGTNVVAIGSGSLSVSGSGSLSAVLDGVQASASYLVIGGGANQVYSGVSGPSNFGAGGMFAASSTTGGQVGIGLNYDSYVVPNGYVAGTPLNSTSTWDNATLSSLGLTVGTYTYTLGSGDKFVINVALSYTVNIVQSGSNVVATGSGSLSVSGSGSLTAILDGVEASASYLVIGGGANQVYSGVSGPSNFGPGGMFAASSTTGGQVGFGLNYDAYLVPNGYVAGTPLNSTSTWDNATLSSLGLTVGTYTYTLGSGDKFVINVVSPLSINTSQQPATATVGSSIADMATVTGLVNPSSGDTVTFNLYSSATVQNSSTLLFSSTQPALISGSTATATSSGYTTAATGTDYWVATFSGDSNNSAVTSGATAEPVSVTPASQTITFTTNAPASAVYGSGFTVAASASSGLTPVTFTSSGSCTNSGATYTMTAGTGTCTVIANQAGNSTYSAAPTATESVSAIKAVLTVTATSFTQPYGTAIPTLTYSFSGFVSPDTSSVVSGAPVLATTATATSLPGAYPITITQGTLSAANYTFNLVPGTLTVTLPVGPGQCVPFPVTLAAPAGPTGAAVTLTSSNPSIADFYPGVNPIVVIIEPGQTSPTRGEIPQLCGVQFGTVNVTAAPGVTTTSQTVTVQVTATLSFAQASSTVTNGRQGRIELDLSVPAPAPGGLTVNLTSSNTAVATVPATILIPANQTSVIVPVTTVATGSTTITASDLPNVPATTASLTVQ